MARRRLQQKGNLYKQSGQWKLRWLEDRADADGNPLPRGWSKPVWLGPASGPHARTEKEARRDAWELYLSKLDQNNTTPMSVIPVGEFIERKFRPEHIAFLKTGGQKHYGELDKETGKYGGLLAHLPKWFLEMRLRDVRMDEVQRIVSGVVTGTYTVERKGKSITKRYSVQTALHLKNVISAIFRHAKAKGWYSGDNPAENVRLPEMERKESHALTFAQLKAVLEATDYPVRHMVLFSVLTSCNVAEIAGLKWKRVNLTDGWLTCDGETLPPRTLVIRQQWKYGKYQTVKVKSRLRPLPVPDALRAMLLELKARPQWTGEDDPVFACRTGRPVDTHNLSNRVLRKVGAALNMPWLGWHAFRRTHTTLADQLQMSLGDRMAMMGHTDARTTMLYTLPDLERRREVLERMGSTLFEAEGGRVQ